MANISAPIVAYCVPGDG